MKNLKSIVIGVMLLLTYSVNAQVTVNVNLSPPSWGPVGYTEVRYYYLPDVEAYYDLHTHKFIYLYGGNWIHRSYLPSRYRGYDLYGGYKVVMKNYHGKSPYVHYKYHKGHYAKGYKGKGPQKTIGHKPGYGKQKGSSPAHHKSSPAKHNASPGHHKSSPAHHKSSPANHHTSPAHHNTGPGKGAPNKGGHSKGGKGGGKK